LDQYYYIFLKILKMGRKHNNKRNQNKKVKTESIDIESLDIDMKEKFQEFTNTTLNKDTFMIQNVAEDNACLYRSISNGLFHIVECDGDTGGDVLYSIGNWKTTVDTEKTYKNKFWGYKGSEQTYLATKIQQIARQWLIKNYQQLVDDVPGYKVVDLVRDSHGFELEADDAVMALYDICYAKFAGMPRKRKLRRLIRKFSESDSMEQYQSDYEQTHNVFDECAIDDSQSENESDEDVFEDPDYMPENNNMQVDNLYNDNDNDNDNENEDENDNDNDIEDELYGDYFETDMTSHIETNEFEYGEDDDFIDTATSENHERLKEAILKKCDISELWDRWGSSAEVYAISKYFKVPIVVYAPKRFNFKNGRIENGRLYKDVKPDKNVRFQVLQMWGSEYRDTTPPVELLYRKLKGNVEHYMVLYRN
jgi:hypothetical protein